MSEQPVVIPMRRRFRWTDGVLVGLAAAVSSTAILLLAGILSGQGVHILTDAAMAPLPHAVQAATGISTSLSYLLTHTLIYLLAGVTAIALTNLADRSPPVLTGTLLVIIIVEFAFLVFTTERQASGRIEAATWRSLLIAHAVADIVFAFGIVRAHPGLRQSLVRGYEW